MKRTDRELHVEGWGILTGSFNFTKGVQDMHHLFKYLKEEAFEICEGAECSKNKTFR